MTSVSDVQFRKALSLIAVTLPRLIDERPEHPLNASAAMLKVLSGQVNPPLKL